ncbi:MAG: type II secretion system protein N [Telluria sp.]|nr:type II secretion system protein N [Telluria sp.]
MKRLPLLLSFFAVIVLAGSLAYWALQLYRPQQRPLAAAPPAAMPEPSVDAAASLFGGQAAALATNYQLTGVISAGRDSAAILVAEGKPPQALKVGKELAPGVSIKEVHPRYVMLSEGGVLKRVDIATDSKAGLDMSSPGAGAGAAPQSEPPPMPSPAQEAAPAATPPMLTSSEAAPPPATPPAGTPAAAPPPVQMPAPVRPAMPQAGAQRPAQ